MFSSSFTNTSLAKDPPAIFWNCSSSLSTSAWSSSGNATSFRQQLFELAQVKWATVVGIFSDEPMSHLTVDEYVNTYQEQSDYFYGVFAICLLLPLLVFCLGAFASLGSLALYVLDFLKLEKRCFAAKSFHSLMSSRRYGTRSLQTSLLDSEDHSLGSTKGAAILDEPPSEEGCYESPAAAEPSAASPSPSGKWFPLRTIKDHQQRAKFAVQKVKEDMQHDRRFVVSYFKDFLVLRHMLTVSSFLHFPGSSERLLRMRQFVAVLWCLFPLIDALALDTCIVLFGGSKINPEFISAFFTTLELTFSCFSHYNETTLEENRMLNNGSALPLECNDAIASLSISPHLEYGFDSSSASGLLFLSSPSEFGQCCVGAHTLGSVQQNLPTLSEYYSSFTPSIRSSYECALKEGFTVVVIASITLVLGLLQNLFSFIQGRSVTRMGISERRAQRMSSYADWLLHHCIHTGELTCELPSEVPVRALRDTPEDVARVSRLRRRLRTRVKFSATLMWLLSCLPMVSILIVIVVYDNTLRGTSFGITIDFVVFLYGFSFFGSCIITLAVNGLFMAMCEAHITQLCLFRERLVEFVRASLRISAAGVSEGEHSSSMSTVFASLQDVTAEYGRIVRVAKRTYKRFNVFLYGTLVSAVVVIVSILFAVTIVSTEYTGVLSTAVIVGVFPMLTVMCLLAGALGHVARVDLEAKRVRSDLATCLASAVNEQSTSVARESNVSEESKEVSSTPQRCDNREKDDARSFVGSTLDGLLGLEGFFESFHPALTVLSLTVDLRFFVRGGTLLVTFTLFLIRQKSTIESFIPVSFQSS